MPTSLPEPWILIPAHDEATAIASVVAGCRKVLPRVLVVADNCRDGTAHEAEKAGARVLLRSGAGGKGMALRSGWDYLRRETNCSHVILLDGDGQHDPDEIPRFLAAAEAGADLVLGNRAPFHAPMPWVRRCCNRLMTAVTGVLAGRRLQDSQCGFRLMSRRLFEGEWRSQNFEIDTEVVLRVCGGDFVLAEVSVTTRYAAEDSSIRPWRDTWRWLDFVVRFNL